MKNPRIRTDFPREISPGVFAPAERVEAECPFCLGRECITHYRLTATQSATHFIRESFDAKRHHELIGVIRNLWRGDECQFARCLACKGVFSWPFVGGDAAFYEIAYTHSYGYPQNRWEFGAALRWMEKNAPETGGVAAELGAGNGAFIKRLLASGFQPGNLFAIEYSPRACQAISAIHPAITVWQDTEPLFSEAENNPGRFSHAFGFQVLEHLGEPLKYLQMFRRLLAPGGVALFAVPNPMRTAFNEGHGLLLDMAPNHVSRFSRGALQALADRSGFILDHVECEEFRVREGFVEHLNFHFKRRLQFGGTLQNWTERHLPWRAATMAGALLALPSAVRYLPGRSDGASLFFVLRKPS